MLLTESERQKFIDYLERDAESNDLIAGQLDRMCPPLANQKRLLSTAQRLVAKELSCWESQTIG